MREITLQPILTTRGTVLTQILSRLGLVTALRTSSPHCIADSSRETARGMDHSSATSEALPHMGEPSGFSSSSPQVELTLTPTALANVVLASRRLAQRHLAAPAPRALVVRMDR